MDIQRLLGKDQYDAAMNSSSPSAVNPFVTVADVDGVYIPLAGTDPGAPLTGPVIVESPYLPLPNFNALENELTGNSGIQFFQPGFSAFDGQATNPGILTGFAYSFFTGFDVTSFYPVGTDIFIKDTQNGSNDGLKAITAIHWDGVTNWVQWAGMITETSAPYGDFSTIFEGLQITSYSPGTDTFGGFFNTPTYQRFFMRSGSYGPTNYWNSEITINDNRAADVGGFFTYQSFPATVAAQDWTIRQGVISSVILGGRQANMKTDYTAYVEQLAFARSSGGTETLVVADKTTNVDRLVTIQDGDGTLAFLTDIPAATGDGIYSGSGTVPTTTAATLTDTFAFNSDTLGLLFVDGVNDRIGFGIENPAYGVQIENGDMYLGGDGNFAIGGTTPQLGIKQRITLSDSDAAAEKGGLRIDLSQSSQGSYIYGVSTRSTGVKTSAFSFVSMYSASFNIGGASTGTHDMVGFNADMSATQSGTANVTNTGIKIRSYPLTSGTHHLAKFENVGVDVSNKVLAAISADGITDWVDPSTLIGDFLPLSGGTMTGGIVMTDGLKITSTTGVPEIEFDGNNLNANFSRSTFTAGTIGVTPAMQQTLADDKVTWLMLNATATRLGTFGMYNNDATFQGGVGGGLNYPMVFSVDNWRVEQSVGNSVLIAGDEMIAKTNNTAYANQFGFNKGGEVFETILDFTTPTADRTQTLQDSDGVIALTSDITVDAVAQTYTATNVTTDRTYDADSSSVDELADVVGTLIADLKTSGIIL